MHATAACAFSPDLGITPVDPRVEACCRNAISRLAEAGVEVVEAHPDMSDAHEAFQILRAHGFASSLHEEYTQHRDMLKPEVIWNIEKGLELTSGEIARAERMRSAMFSRTAAFLAVIDLLLTPATIVPAYPVEDRYVAACNGITFDTYIDWLAIAYAITLTGLPCTVTAGGADGRRPARGDATRRQDPGEAMLLSHAAWVGKTLGRLPTPIETSAPPPAKHSLTLFALC